MSFDSARTLASTYLRNVGKRAAVEVITLRRVKEPRLRFDRVAIGLVRRLRASLSKYVPEGKTLIVTVTAPIWQDSKTGLVLADKLQRLLATRRTQLNAEIYGNRIRARLLEGGSSHTPRVIGFVHNPEPNPTALFRVTRSLLASIGSRNQSRTGIRCLVVDNQGGHAPVATVRQVCRALRVRKVFNRILLVERGTVRAL